MKILKIAGSIIGILLIMGVFINRNCTVKQEITISKPWDTLFELFTEKYGIRCRLN